MKLNQLVKDIRKMTDAELLEQCPDLVGEDPTRLLEGLSFR